MRVPFETYIVAAVICVLAWCAWGCGPRMIEVQARAGLATREVLNATAEQIERVCTIHHVQDLAEQAPLIQTPEGPVINQDEVERFIRACNVAIDAHGEAIDIWVLWMDALVMAHAERIDLAHTLNLAKDVFRLYMTTVHTLQTLGVRAPDPPRWLLRLLGPLTEDDGASEKGGKYAGTGA